MKTLKPNLSKGEEKTVGDLAKRKYIMVANADKGGAVVRIVNKKFINEFNDQSLHRDNYMLFRKNLILSKWLIMR